MGTLLRSIEPGILKSILDDAMDLFAEDVSLLDLDRVVTIINKLDYKKTGEMLTKIDPNILGIALGIMLWSFRKAKVAPGIFFEDESIETLEINPNTGSSKKRV